mgnify:CR=1 FL=1
MNQSDNEPKKSGGISVYYIVGFITTWYFILKFISAL